MGLASHHVQNTLHITQGVWLSQDCLRGGEIGVHRSQGMREAGNSGGLAEQVNLGSLHGRH